MFFGGEDSFGGCMPGMGSGPPRGDVDTTKLYETLEVEKSATEKDIRKIYMRGGDEHKFKEISAAYEILSDEDSHAQYYKYGLEGLSGDDVGSGGEDLFSVFFGGPSPTKAIRKGAMKEALSSAQKAVKGARKELQDVEAVLDSLMADESSDTESQYPRGSSPSPVKYKPHEAAAKQGNLYVDLHKIVSAATHPPKGLKSPDSSTSLVSKAINLTSALKEMNSNGGRTPKKGAKSPLVAKSPVAGMAPYGRLNKAEVSKETPMKGAKSPMADKDSDEKVGKEVNTEEDAVFECKATPFMHDLEGDNPFEWTKTKGGTLQLYRDKTLVQRNAFGTVTLKIPIGENMVCLEKMIKTVKKKMLKPKKVAYVRFFAKAGDDMSMENFLYQVKPDKLDTLYEMLKVMGAEVKDDD